MDTTKIDKILDHYNEGLILLDEAQLEIFLIRAADKVCGCSQCNTKQG